MPSADCASPTSAKTGSKTPMVGSPLQGMGAPSLTKAAHKPSVLSQTLLPPAFAPEITKQRAWSVPSAASLPLGSGPPAALRLRA